MLRLLKEKSRTVAIIKGIEKIIRIIKKKNRLELSIIKGTE